MRESVVAVNPPTSSGPISSEPISSEPTSSEHASGSSFYTAMRILPRAQRAAMYEIYSFCRRVDDIADSQGHRPERLAALNQWRAEIDGLYQGKIGTLVQGLAPHVRFAFGARVLVCLACLGFATHTGEMVLR